MSDMKRFGIICLYSFFIICVLYGHIHDDNIWGIYIEDGHLLVGDFWAALAIVFCWCKAWMVCKEGLYNFKETPCNNDENDL